MRLIVIVTIYATRRDNADWRLLVFHGADLHARGLGAQQAGRIEPESVVVSTRRVMTRNVQGVEVVVIVFDFRTCRDGKAELTEETFNAVDSTGNRVQAAIFDTTPGRETSMVSAARRAFSAAFSRSVLRAFSAC